MDMSNGPGMIQPSPGQGNVLASLKRNVLWGVLGLVALIFTTVCVMYVSSRQTEAAVAAEPVPVTVGPMEPTAAFDTVTPPSLPTPNPVTAQTATLPPAEVLPTTAASATAPAAARTSATSTPIAAVQPVAKPAPVTVAKPEIKPVTKPAATLKSLDLKDIPHGTKIYVVKSGDTLEKIAREVYGDGHKWKRLADLNKDYVNDINRLKVGQKILVERTPNPRDYADY